MRQTDSGRTVYGGGGITPDYVVRAERESALLSRLRRENLLFDYAVRYVASHPDLKPGFVVGDDGIKDFQTVPRLAQLQVRAEAFEGSRKGIELRLRSQIGRVKWGAEAESKILIEGDTQVQKALTLFDEAAKLAAAGRARAPRQGREGRQGHGPEGGGTGELSVRPGAQWPSLSSRAFPPADARWNRRSVVDAAPRRACAPKRPQEPQRQARGLVVAVARPRDRHRSTSRSWNSWWRKPRPPVRVEARSAAGRGTARARGPC